MNFGRILAGIADGAGQGLDAIGGLGKKAGGYIDGMEAGKAFKQGDVYQGLKQAAGGLGRSKMGMQPLADGVAEMTKSTMDDMKRALFLRRAGRELGVDTSKMSEYQIAKNIQQMPEETKAAIMKQVDDDLQRYLGGAKTAGLVGAGYELGQ